MNQPTRDLVADLTLREQAGLCSGRDLWSTRPVDRVDLPSVVLADGPHGVRRPAGNTEVGLLDARPATCFPTASAMASTWDRDLVHEVGAAIGREARALDVDVVLGPGVNLKRSPRCGRNFEYWSEDPYLGGRLAAALVDGIQSTGIGACVKHLAANTQETRRMTIDVVTDERSLRELELASFEHVVTAARPWMVMGAYNRLNGTHACEHPWLLGDVLRGDWGFDGVVVSDWGAINDRVAAVAAGCDLDMPGIGGSAPAELLAAVDAGDLDPEVLEVAAGRVVALARRAEAARTLPVEPVDHDAHHALARRAAARAVVVATNRDATLPIDPAGGDTVAVIGTMGATPRFQGTGSSRISPTKVDDLWTGLVGHLGADRVVLAPGLGPDPEVVDGRLVAEAVTAASTADVAVVCVGLPEAWENEGDDRGHLRLPPAHDALVAAVAAAHQRVVVVVTAGAPVEVPWADDVEAVVLGHLGGQAGGTGTADVLVGAAEPSGRLAETWPLRLEDTPAHRQFPGGPATVEHREGLYVGYRFHDTVDGPVRFPFGHGLSYATTTWHDVAAGPDAIDDAALRSGKTVEVSVSVTNDGDRPAREVVQVYVRDPEAAVHRPDHELRGFAAVEVAPGATERVTVHLDRRAFAFWHVDRQDWVVESGTFDIEVAASSRDVRGTATVEVDGEELAPRDEPAVYRDPPRFLDVDRTSFEVILGRPVPPNDPPSRPWTRDTPIGEVADSPQGRLFRRLVARGVRAQFAGDPTAEPLVRAMTTEAPLRTLTMGGLSLPQLDLLVDVMNGRGISAGRRVVELLRSRRR